MVSNIFIWFLVLAFYNTAASAATSPTYLDQQGLINLTPANSSLMYFLDRVFCSLPDILTFAAPSGYTLDIFLDDYATSDNNNFALYDSSTTDNFVGLFRNLSKPLEDYIPVNYASKSGFLTIVFRSGTTPSPSCRVGYGLMFLRLREIHAANCLSSNNVYSLFDRELSATATDTGSCMLTVMEYFYIRITLISATQPKNGDQYELIPNMDRTVPYLKFTNKDVDLWTDIYEQQNNFFSFIIPASQTLTFLYNFSGLYEMDYNDEYVFTNKGILTSKCFNNPHCAKFSRYGMNVIAPGFMQIRVNYLDFSQNSRISIVWGAKETVVTQVGQVITASDNATIFMEEREDNHGQAIFEIDVISSQASQTTTKFPDNSTGLPGNHDTGASNILSSFQTFAFFFTIFINIIF